MKKLFRVAAAMLLAAMLLSLLAACGGGKIKDDVPVDDLSTAVDKAIGNEGDMMAVDAGYVKNTLSIDESSYEAFAVRVNAGNLDEYGIFKGKDKAQTNALAAAVKSYLEKRNEAWTHQYMQDMYPKLRDAEYKVVGNYVIYGILTEDAKAAGFKALETQLQ